MNTKLSTILISLLLLIVACDQQTKQAQTVGRCVMNDPRLSTIIKDPPKAKQWVQSQVRTWKEVKARVDSNVGPFVTEEDLKVLMDEADVLDRLSVCLDPGGSK